MKYSIESSTLKNELATRINEVEAELEALEKVTINTNHKTLTNRTVENGRIGDYIGIGKALFVSYKSYNRYMSTDITAYTYEDENGQELGTNGIMRISRTMTPLELHTALDKVIEGRKESLKKLKLDLVNADRIVKKYNKLATQMNELTEGLTWATRAVLKK